MLSRQSFASVPLPRKIKDFQRAMIFLERQAAKAQNAPPEHENTVEAVPPKAHTELVQGPSRPRTMFQVEISPPMRFVKVLSAVAESLRIVQFECTDSGFFVRTMDEAHVLFVELDLTRTFFTSYTSSSTIKVGVQLHELSKFLKHISNYTSLVMQITASEASLQCSASDLEGTTIRSYSAARLHVEADELSVSVLEYPVTLTFATKSLRQVIERLGHFGVTLYITVTSATSLVFGTQSDNIAIRETVYLNDASACSGSINQTQVGSIFAYPMKYVNNIFAVSGVADTTMVSFGTGVPLCIRFDLDSTGDSHLTYYIPEAVLPTPSMPTSDFTAL